jgi:phosphoribosylamine-glycine ligase
MDKYIFISRDFHPLPMADRLIDDGKQVVIGLADLEEGEKISPEKNEARKHLYDGILTKHSADEVMEEMKKLPEKDEWFVYFDYGDLWPLAEKALAMGFTKGLFPTEEAYTLEKDRQAGKDFAKKYYPEVKVAEVHEFKKADDAIKFLDEQKESIFVLKSEGSNAETVVPATTDVDLARRQVVGALQTESRDYERGGFTLEEKIRKPIEITPVMVFWDGKPLYSIVELENKPLGSGNIGRLTGGCQNLTIRTHLECRLNEIAFPPIIYEMAKKQPGLSIYDAGLLFDGEGDEFYFTEFCSLRAGFDGAFSQIAMSANRNHKMSVVRHFDLIADGKCPLVWNYGAAVRLFQTEPNGKAPDMYEGGYSMDWLNEFVDQLFFYCIERVEKNGIKQFVSNGFEKDLGTATGEGNTLEEAIAMAYKAARGVAMNGLYYRPQFDFLSRDYFTSIMNRYDWLMKSDLI